MGQKKQLLILAGVFLLFLFSRLVLLTRFPVFNDEAIYLRYGQIMIRYLAPWYSMAVSGKQPLVYWMYGVSELVFHDPLVAGRLVSVLFGLGTLWFVYQTGKMLGGSRGGAIAALLYTLTPLNTFFDRMAIVDGALATLFAAVIYFLLRFVQSAKYRYLVFLAIAIGVSLWIKMTGLLFLVMSLALILSRYKQKGTGRTVVLLLGIVGILIFPLVIQREFARVLAMQADYSMTLPELLRLPFATWSTNIVNTVLVYAGYVSPFVFLGAVLCVSGKKSKEAKMVIFSWLLPLLLLVLVGRGLHGRYLLFTTIPMILLSALWLSKRRLLLVVTLASMALSEGILIVAPQKFFHLFPQIGIYKNETTQYIDGWSSGYGVREALAFVDADREGKPAFIGVRWDSGNPEDTVIMYAPRYYGIAVAFLDTRLKPVDTVLAGQAGKRLYFITRKGQLGPLGGTVRLLKSFSKPYDTEAVEVYGVVSSGTP